MHRAPAVFLALALPACAPSPQAPSASSAQTSSAAAPQTASYPTMAPIAGYRMASAEEEAKLARTAAPPSVADAAEVLVLGEHGYVTASKGSNGFTCLVERGWAGNFADPGFWNPKNRSPLCLNAAAVRSVLPEYLKRTEWVLGGASMADLIARTKAALATKEFGPPETGAMCFMMSKDGYLNDNDGHWHPHVMLWVPGMAAKEWGANLPGSPLFAAEGDVNPVTIIMSPVRRWSDGTLDVPKQ